MEAKTQKLAATYLTESAAIMRTGNPSTEFVEHFDFQIPRHLAWRTGRLDRFSEVSAEHIENLRKFADLDTACDIVEIGCGVGRDAIPLIKLLPSAGSYLGIDVMRQSIEWASENITVAAPQFSFVQFDVADKQHNPSGKGSMREYRIPRPDASQDLVFLYSVFTHMFPEDVSLYLKEFQRILRPGGRVLASMFIMERTLIPHLQSIGGGGLRNLTFEHEIEPGFFHNDPSVVPGATAYSIDKVFAMASEASLLRGRFVKGSWAKDGSSEIGGQDIVVLKKAAD